VADLRVHNVAGRVLRVDAKLTQLNRRRGRRSAGHRRVIRDQITVTRGRDEECRLCGGLRHDLWLACHDLLPFN